MRDSESKRFSRHSKETPLGGVLRVASGRARRPGPAPPYLRQRHFLRGALGRRVERRPRLVVRVRGRRLVVQARVRLQRRAGWQLRERRLLAGVLLAGVLLAGQQPLLDRLGVCEADGGTAIGPQVAGQLPGRRGHAHERTGLLHVPGAQAPLSDRHGTGGLVRRLRGRHIWITANFHWYPGASGPDLRRRRAGRIAHCFHG